MVVVVVDDTQAWITTVSVAVLAVVAVLRWLKR